MAPNLGGILLGFLALVAPIVIIVQLGRHIDRKYPGQARPRWARPLMWSVFFITLFIGGLVANYFAHYMGD